MNAPAAWVPVCRLEEIVPDTGVCAFVHGRQVAVFRLADDRLFALDNFDPFSKANVLSRGLVGDLKGEAGFMDSGDICAATPKLFPLLLEALR